MKVKVDPDLCLGCGICEGDAPEVFSMEDGIPAKVLVDPVPQELEDSARTAAEDCPEGAILIEDEAAGASDEAITAAQESPADEQDETKQSTKEKEMRAIVDKDLCIGCGICEGIAPEVFSLAKEPYAEVIEDPIAEEHQEAAKEAAAECPELAITIEE